MENCEEEVKQDQIQPKRKKGLFSGFFGSSASKAPANKAPRTTVPVYKGKMQMSEGIIPMMP